MKTNQYTAKHLLELLKKKKIATMQELKLALGTNAEATVYRKLNDISGITSYSHRGKYYTLDTTPEWDAFGLWSFRSVWFSARGTLISTIENLVGTSKGGYYTSELENILHVEVKVPLLKLLSEKRIERQKIFGRYLYISTEKDKLRIQITERRSWKTQANLGDPFLDPDYLPDELKASIILFFSMLDEKQRRLYAGIESLKIGHGGDRRVSEVLGINVDTVARGRSELLERDIDIATVRKSGGGRKSVEKKHRK